MNYAAGVDLSVIFSVLFDEELERFDGNSYGIFGAFAHILIKTGGFAFLVPDDMEAGTGAATESRGNDEKGRGFHFARLYAEALPAFPFIEELIIDGRFFGAVLTVEAVLVLDDADMIGKTEVPCGIDEAVGNIEIRNRGIFDGSIFHGGVFIADGTGRNDDIVGFYVKVDAAAGSGADKSIGTALVEFLHGDGGGRSADSGGAGGYFFSEEVSGPDVVFTVLGNLFRVVKIGGYGLDSSGIAGKNAIAADVSFIAMYMECFFHFLHGCFLLSGIEK